MSFRSGLLIIIKLKLHCRLECIALPRNFKNPCMPYFRFLQIERLALICAHVVQGANTSTTNNSLSGLVANVSRGTGRGTWQPRLIFPGILIITTTKSTSLLIQLLIHFVVQLSIFSLVADVYIVW